MSPSSIRPRASMSASLAYEWLWCDDHVKVTQWFVTQPRLTYKEFYASFMNYANAAWENSRQQSHAPLVGLPKFVVELLKNERIPADELLAALKEYSVGLDEGKGYWKEKGLVGFANGLNDQTLTAGKNKLRGKVMKDLQKTFSSAARLRAGPATRSRPRPAANQATMADQRTLPAFTAPFSFPAFVPPSSLPGPAPSPRGPVRAWDPFVHSDESLSLASVGEVIGDLGPAAPGEQAQRATTLPLPVKFSSLPLVGGKKANEEEMMDDAVEEEEEDQDVVM